MTSRTIRSVAHFSRSFWLPGFDEAQPSGDYQVEHEEEAIDSMTTVAWRRTACFIHLPGIGMRATRHEIAAIDAADLESALEKDRLGS
jgi:hypothetical protein